MKMLSRFKFTSMCLLLLLILVGGEVSAQTCNPGELGGVVFRDYNSDGIRDAFEPVEDGITATVYDQAGAVIATGVTAFDGTYVLPVPDGTPVRVEFTGLPTFLEPSAAGTDSATSVQFLTNSATCDVNFAVQNVAEFCGDSPELATSCFLGTGATGSGVVTFPIDAGTTSTTSNALAGTPLYTSVAEVEQVGPVHGISYHRSTELILASALTKRHSGFPGGVTVQATLIGTGAAEFWSLLSMSFCHLVS